MYKWHFKLYEDSLDMYKEPNDTTDDFNNMGEALENITLTDITNERNVQGTDITSEKNVQILYTQNLFTVQVFTKPVYSTCIHRICTGMEFNQQ